MRKAASRGRPCERRPPASHTLLATPLPPPLLLRLGPFFGLSSFPSEVAVATQCFPDVSNPMMLEQVRGSPLAFSDLLRPFQPFSDPPSRLPSQAMSAIRSSTGLIVRALTSITKELLKNPEAKEPLFR